MKKGTLTLKQISKYYKKVKRQHDEEEELKRVLADPDMKYVGTLNGKKVYSSELCSDNKVYFLNVDDMIISGTVYNTKWYHTNLMVLLLLLLGILAYWLFIVFK